MRAILPLLVTVALGIKIPLLTTVALQTNSKDAMQDVMDLLYELQDLNLKEQQDADIRNDKEQAECSSTLTTLGENLNLAENDWNSAKNHLKFVDDELKTTQENIAYIEARLKHNQEQLIERQRIRCEESNAFVQKVVDHREALEVIELLRKDIDMYFATGDKGFLELAKQMIQLVPGTSGILAELTGGQENEGYGEDFYKKSYDADEVDEHHDNDRDVIKTEDTSKVVGQRPDFDANLEEKTEEILQKLEDHILKSLKDLEDNELKAAYDFAKWLASTNKENRELQSELSRKKEYEVKLISDLVIAKEYEAKTHLTYENALEAYNAKKVECEHKSEYYRKETERRKLENVEIDACIALMKEAVPEMDEYTRQRADSVDETPAPSKRIYDYSFDRSNYESTGGYQA